jgi:hypothetical protein
MQRFRLFNRRVGLIRAIVMALALGLIVGASAAAPGTFNLISPGTEQGPGPFFTDPANITSFVWSESANADNYTFTLTLPDSTPLTNVGLTPGDDGDGLICEAGTCELSFNGAQFLTQQGNYSWTVTAFDLDDGNSSQGPSDGPLYFRIDSIAPEAFTQASPGSATPPGIEIEDVSEVTAFTWTPSTGATRYNLLIDRPVSSNIGFNNLSPAADGDALTCTAELCTFTVAGTTILLDEGVYSWTVTALDAAGNTRTASNAPLYFEVDTTPPPGPFNLAAPGSNAYPGPTVTDPTTITTATWGTAQNAVTYTFRLIRPSLPQVVFSGLTPAADGDALSCSASVCTLNFNAALFLTEDGVYRWSVDAAAADGDTTTAANAPFFFNVQLSNFNLPGEFNLLTPPNETYLRDVDALTLVTWEAADNVLTYEFAMYKIGITPEVRLGVIAEITNLTPASDGDPVTCTATVCTLTVPQSIRDQHDTGRYSWTVVARNNSGIREAANGPFFFSVDEGPVELLRNGGMELDANENRQPDEWIVRGNQAGDRLRCNVTDRPNNRPDQIFANSGECAYQFRGGGTPTVLRYNVPNNVVAAMNLDAGTTLQASVAIRGNRTPSNAVMRVIVRYSDPNAGVNNNGRDRFVIPLTLSSANNTYQTITQGLNLDGEVERVSLLVRYTGATGRFYVDDLSLIVQPVSGVPLPVNPPVAVPVPGDDLLPLPLPPQDSDLN